ncbi:MAG: pilus assembly PilX N-terminal domain-containing protein [bacterium]
MANQQPTTNNQQKRQEKGLPRGTKYSTGVTLFIAILVMGTLLLISTAVISIAVRESYITRAARESQYAFYAADTGAECALYWDVKNVTGVSAFSTTTVSTIFCNKDANNLSNQWVVGGSYESWINPPITFLPDLYCARVKITKGTDGSTKIESWGYNTCDENSSERVERAVRASY